MRVGGARRESASWAQCNVTLRRGDCEAKQLEAWDGGRRLAVPLRYAIYGREVTVYGRFWLGDEVGGRRREGAARARVRSGGL